MSCSKCARPLVPQGAFLVCSACRRATTRENGRPLDLPRGFELVAEPAGAATAAYRDRAGTGGHVVTRAWWRRWGFQGAFMVVWGGFAALWGLGVGTLPFFGGERANGVPFTLGIGLAALALGLVALRMAIANLANRTYVHVGHGAIERRDAPIRWSREQRVVRDAADTIEVRGVAKNDIRNGGMRWPAPRTYEVVLVGPRREPVVLFEQILSDVDAHAVRALVEAALRATP